MYGPSPIANKNYYDVSGRSIRTFNRSMKSKLDYEFDRIKIIYSIKWKSVQGEVTLHINIILSMKINKPLPVSIRFL